MWANVFASSFGFEFIVDTSCTQTKKTQTAIKFAHAR